MRTDFQNVLVEEDENVVTLTMNRPDVLNAIDTLMLDVFPWQSLMTRPGHWQSNWQMDPLTLMGSSKSFCASRWIVTCRPLCILRDNYKMPPTLQRITGKQ